MFGFGFEISFAYGLQNLFWSLQPVLPYFMCAAVYRWIVIRAARPLSLVVVIGQWGSLVLLNHFLWLMVWAIGDFIDPWPMNIGGRPDVLWGLGWQSSMQLGLALAGFILLVQVVWGVAIVRAFRTPKP